MKKLGPPYARPELRGRYLLRDPLKAAGMRSIDFSLSLIPKRRADIPSHPKRILLCNWAHRGDVVLAFPALARIRELFPDAQIDFLTQTCSREVAAIIPGISRIHTIDHWNLNRSKKSLLDRHLLYRRQRAAVVKEIQSTGYDLAIDFYQHYPTAAFELWQSGIPVRIGYSSGGLSPLLTHSVDWTTDNRHIIARHGDILDLIQPGATALSPLVAGYCWPSRTDLANLHSRGVPNSYILLHTGAGGPHKEWPESRWAEVMRGLAASGRQVVLAGAGPREAARNARLAALNPAALNFTDALDWTDFVALVAGAGIVVGLDSVCVHLAAAFEIPTVCIRSGVVSGQVWGPLNPNALQLTAPTACAPCHRLGCDTMDCLLGVTAPDVIGAIGRLAASNSQQDRRTQNIFDSVGQPAG